MKKTSFTFFFIFFLTKSIIFSQNLTSESISPNLKLQGEMGYITKEMGFPFLFLNELIDTTEQSNEWNKIIPKDTIGKFFRMDSSDHYLVCLPKSLDFFRPLYLFFEIDSTGKIIKKVTFNLGKSKWKNYYKNFEKFQDIFVCSIHHAFFDYYSIDDVYFKQLAPLDSLAKIRVCEWKTYQTLFRNPNKDNTKEYLVYKSILDKKNGLPYISLTCYYYLQRGYYIGKTKNREPEFKLYPFKRKIKVRYILQDNKVETIDQKKLKKVKRFMKVSPKRVRL